MLKPNSYVRIFVRLEGASPTPYIQNVKAMKSHRSLQIVCKLRVSMQTPKGPSSDFGIKRKPPISKLGVSWHFELSCVAYFIVSNPARPLTIPGTTKQTKE
eukprot:3942357-Amphidinium_carterae.1